MRFDGGIFDADCMPILSNLLHVCHKTMKRIFIEGLLTSGARTRNGTALLRME